MYCNVSVLESWRNTREAGKKRGQERKVIERERQEGESGERSKRSRERERSREERKAIEMKWETEAEEWLSQRERNGT